MPNYEQGKGIKSNKDDRSIGKPIKPINPEQPSQDPYNQGANLGGDPETELGWDAHGLERPNTCDDWNDAYPWSGFYKVPPTFIMDQMPNCYYYETQAEPYSHIDPGWWCEACSGSGHEGSNSNMVYGTCVPWWVFSGNPNCGRDYVTPPDRPTNVYAHPCFNCHTHHGVSDQFSVHWNGNNRSRSVTYNVYRKEVDNVQSSCNLDNSHLIASGVNVEELEDILDTGESYQGVRCYRISAVDNSTRNESDLSEPGYASQCTEWANNPDCQACCRAGVCTHEFAFNCVNNRNGIHQGGNTNCLPWHQNCADNCGECDECPNNGSVDDCGVCDGDCIFPPDGDCHSCECPPGYDECGECGGPNINCNSDTWGTLQCPWMDCNGDCNGGAEIDACGVCDGNNEDYWCGINCGEYQCNSSDCHESDIQCRDCDDECICDLDCSGNCGGTLVEDECGICGGDGSTCCPDLCSHIRLMCDSDNCYKSHSDGYVTGDGYYYYAHDYPYMTNHSNGWVYPGGHSNPNNASKYQCGFNWKNSGLNLDSGTMGGLWGVTDIAAVCANGMNLVYICDQGSGSNTCGWFNPNGELGPDFAPNYYETGCDACSSVMGINNGDQVQVKTFPKNRVKCKSSKPDPDKGPPYTVKNNCEVEDTSGQITQYETCWCNGWCTCGGNFDGWEEEVTSWLCNQNTGLCQIQFNDSGYNSYQDCMSETSCSSYAPPYIPQNVEAHPCFNCHTHHGHSDQFSVHWDQVRTGSRNITYNIYSLQVDNVTSPCDPEDMSLIASGISEGELEDVLGIEFSGVMCYRVTSVDSSTGLESNYSTSAYTSQCTDWATNPNCQSCCRGANACWHELEYDCLNNPRTPGTPGGVNTTCMDWHNGPTHYCNQNCVCCDLDMNCGCNKELDSCGVCMPPGGDTMDLCGRCNGDDDYGCGITYGSFCGCNNYCDAELDECGVCNGPGGPCCTDDTDCCDGNGNNCTATAWFNGFTNQNGTAGCEIVISSLYSSGIDLHEICSWENAGAFQGCGGTTLGHACPSICNCDCIEDRPCVDSAGAGVCKAFEAFNQTTIPDCQIEACHNETWVGDGYCDGPETNYAYGADLTCYDCDGGDCNQGSDYDDGACSSRSNKRLLPGMSKRSK